MKIVIDIPDENYKKDNLIHFFGCYSEKLDEVIKNGTPLPKGQGVSLESLDEDAKETVSHLVECYEDDCFTKNERVTLAGIALQARLRYQLNKYADRSIEDGKDENNKV